MLSCSCSCTARLLDALACRLAALLPRCDAAGLVAAWQLLLGGGVALEGLLLDSLALRALQLQVGGWGCGVANNVAGTVSWQTNVQPINRWLLVCLRVTERGLYGKHVRCVAYRARLCACTQLCDPCAHPPNGHLN